VALARSAHMLIAEVDSMHACRSIAVTDVHSRSHANCSLLPVAWLCTLAWRAQYYSPHGTRTAVDLTQMLIKCWWWWTRCMRNTMESLWPFTQRIFTRNWWREKT